jgi:hypothetical protein
MRRAKSVTEIKGVLNGYLGQLKLERFGSLFAILKVLKTSLKVRIIS